MDALSNKIAGAFCSVIYPGDDNLTDSTYGEEPAALVEAFRGKTSWQALDSDFLDKAPDGWGSALSFFSADAFCFYLPAYLIADLKGELDLSDPTSRLCSFVTPQAEGQKIAKRWGGGTTGEHSRKVFSKFDAAQVDAIVAYLWWRLDRDVYDPIIEQSLENYWLDRASASSEPDTTAT